MTDNYLIIHILRCIVVFTFEFMTYFSFFYVYANSSSHKSKFNWCYDLQSCRTRL